MANENNQDRNKQNQNNDANLIDSENTSSSAATGQRDNEAQDLNDTDES